MRVTCTGTNRAGNRCGRSPVPGGTVCKLHGGAAPQVAARAAIRREVMAWGLGTPDVDPIEILLRLISQSAARASHYAAELERLEAEHGLLAAVTTRSRFVTADGQVIETGEAVRVLARLEAEERDRLSKFAALAVNAGVEQRRVALAEKQGGQIADVFKMVMADPLLNLSPEQRAVLPVVVRRALGIGDPPRVIDAVPPLEIDP